MDAAIISLIGVLFSALISTIVARQTALFQLKIQTDQQFSVLIFQNRLDSYRILYKYLSDFIKILKFGKLSSNGDLDLSISKEDIVGFMTELEKWDSENAILFTDYASDICSNLRNELYNLVKKSGDEIRSDFNSPDIRKIWVDRIRSLEATIKNEIGVYAIKPFPANTDFRPISTYDEARKIAAEKMNSKTLPKVK
jgi:hypothetical protein